MQKMLILSALALLASCAPTNQATATNTTFDLLKGKPAPLVIVKDSNGAQILRFAHLPKEPSLLEGLALYDSVVSPGFNTMTSFKPNQIASIIDPAKGLNIVSEKPAYELLLCVAQNKTEGLYSGIAYNLEKTDRSAILAIFAGINQNQDGAQDMLAEGLKTMTMLGTCEINANNLM